jgi:hypothetical protein
MVSRLASVIHYFGFVVGVVYGFYIWILAIDNFSFDLDGTKDVVIQAIFALATYGICTGLGWVIRYILVGKIPFNPFNED